MAKIEGGDKLQAYLEKLSKMVNSASSVDVGWPGGDTYPDGTPIAQVAAWNEFGTLRIESDPDGGGDIISVRTPARPFFRNMVSEKSPKWGPALGALLKKNEFDAAKALGAAGEAIKGQLEQSIVDFTTPGNAPSTIARKGFDAPLRDTKHMLQSIKSVVRK